MGSPTSASLTISNIKPSAQNVEVVSDGAYSQNNPSSYAAGDTLTCSFDYDDVDGPILDGSASSFEWLIKEPGIEIPIPNATTETLNFGFAKGDQVVCRVTPFDGDLSGVSQDEAVSISNAYPKVTGVEIVSDSLVSNDGNPYTAVAGDTLECVYVFDDPDGDANQSVESFRDLNSAGGGWSSATAPYQGNLSFGQQWECQVSPHDGMTSNAPKVPSSNQIIVLNTAPTAVNVTVLALTNADGDNNATTGSTLDTLTCSWDHVDADFLDSTDKAGDIVEWRVNGVTVSTGTLPTFSGAFLGGDTVSCLVSAYDGTDYGAPNQINFPISNTAPTAVNLRDLGPRRFESW